MVFMPYDRLGILFCEKHMTKKLTARPRPGYNNRMRKIFIGFILFSSLLVAACGVKSELARPDASFPRDYPVY